MTDRTARRLFDRLVRLSAARELTGLRSGCMAYERRVAPVPAVRNLVCRGRFSHHALANLSSNMMANWVFSLAPFAWRHFPCLRNLAQDEIQQFDRSLIGWKNRVRRRQ
jgi:hypothetical protein